MTEDINNCIRDYVINNFLADNFLLIGQNEYELRENNKEGKSILRLKVSSDRSICIENIDDKKSDILYFRDKDLSGNNTYLKKRVDHIIFSYLENNIYDAHLFEMKTGIENSEKWIDIKGKFRASYLLAHSIAGILHISINDVYMYTTYEHANLMADKTNPISRHARVGGKYTRPIDEWNGNGFALNFGQKVTFRHTPIKMERNTEGILEGCYNI